MSKGSRRPASDDTPTLVPIRSNSLIAEIAQVLQKLWPSKLALFN